MKECVLLALALFSLGLCVMNKMIRTPLLKFYSTPVTNGAFILLVCWCFLFVLLGQTLVGKFAGDGVVLVGGLGWVCKFWSDLVFCNDC